MAFNIERLRQNISAYGYAKQNKFEVFVQEPPIFRNRSLRLNNREVNIRDLNNVHRFRIEQVSTPSISLLSSDVNRYAIGPTQKMPYNAQFRDLTFSVLADQNADLLDFWYNWVNTVFNFNGQEANGNNITPGNVLPTYTARYKEDYSTTMMIVIYNELGETIKTINVYDAFPSSVREIQLAWNDKVNLLRLAVSITYSGYSIVGTNIINNN